ncbi:MAG TPA: HD domain-containing protein [Bellilinea sp.]|nr:HD domain-containing protein [Bellilinea sp.]
MTSADYPTRAQAHTYLDEAERLNPGPWAEHSRNAARAAESIARRIPGMDAEKAYVLALLHDIGRREGVHKDLHSLHGYDFMLREGFPAVAQVCITHGFWEGIEPVDTIYWDGSEADLARIRDLHRGFSFDDYDRLIRLADGLSMHDGFRLLEQRLLDVALRYGVYERTADEWRNSLALKDYFSQLIGCSVYAALPEPPNIA